MQLLELAQRALESGAVLADQLVARAQVLELADQRLKSPLRQGALRLRDGTLVTRVVWSGGERVTKIADNVIACEAEEVRRDIYFDVKTPVVDWTIISKS